MAFEKYTGSLVGGDFKEYSYLTQKSTSSQYRGIMFSAPIIIFELYMDTNNAYSALGLKSSSDEMNPATSHDYSTYPWATYNDTQYCINKSYDFKAELGGSQIYVDSNSESSTRKVFSLHPSNSSKNIFPAHLLYGPITKYTYASTAYFGYSYGTMNKWKTHTAGNGNIYNAITVDANNIFTYTSLFTQKGYKYTIKMHTVSQAGCDGIIISTSLLNSSASVSTAGIARCHGVDAKSTYTYTPTSDGRIYIYFKTDSANLGESHKNYDSRLGFITTYDGFTTGDVEIIVESAPITTTQVTLERNGATSGDTSLEIAYGTDMFTVSVVPPTGKPYCKFAGYYTGSSRNSPGVKYIEASGRGVVGKTWDITDAECTLYALYNYEPEILPLWYPLHCVYCTSSPASASTVQTLTAISLGTLDSSIDGVFGHTMVDDQGSANSWPDTMQDETTLMIPAGTASGDYIFSIRYDFIPIDRSVFIKYKYAECDIWVISTYLVNEVMDLESLTYLEQKKDIPAGSFTLNSNNVSEYFQYPIAIPSTTQIIYNNGQTETSAPRMNWSMHQPITFTSLGTTITSRQQVAIPDNSDIRLTIHPRRVYDGDYYSTRIGVIRIISGHVSSGVVGYFSQLRDLNITFNDYTDILNDLNVEYGIKIDGAKARRVHSVDLLCKYLYVYHNVGSKGSSTDSSIPPIIAKYGTQTGDKVYREANIVDSLSLSVEESSIYVGDKTFADTKASFTSGDEISVNGTYSGYDSSIISINKTAAAICVDNIPDLNDYALEFSKIYGYYGQYNGNYLFKSEHNQSYYEPEYIVTDTIDFDVLLHASYNYNDQFTTPTHIIGRLNADMSNYDAPIGEVRILDVY